MWVDFRIIIKVFNPSGQAITLPPNRQFQKTWTVSFKGASRHFLHSYSFDSQWRCLRYCQYCQYSMRVETNVVPQIDSHGCIRHLSTGVDLDFCQNDLDLNISSRSKYKTSDSPAIIQLESTSTSMYNVRSFSFICNFLHLPSYIREASG